MDNVGMVVDDVVARLQPRGADLIGEMARYEDSYRLCYLSSLEDIILALPQEIGQGRA